MDRLPFGISRLDSMIGGGAPRGSVVLLAGDAGAGAREFLHTSAAMNGLAHGDAELFELHYGELSEPTSIPDEIHYLSFTEGADQIHEEMRFTLDDDIVEAGLDAVEFADLSKEYFQRSPVPREWYVGQNRTLTDLDGDRDRRDVFDAMGDHLSANAPGNLVLIDSLTDLVGAMSDEMTWSDITMLMKGLGRASYEWGGLIVLLVDKDSLSDPELGHLSAAADGTLVFEWESGGSERARTMVVKQFRGVLSRLEEEDIVRFETDLHDGGFDISDVRKIR